MIIELKMPDLPKKIETEEENEYWLGIVEPILLHVAHADSDKETQAYAEALIIKIVEFEQKFYF